MGFLWVELMGGPIHKWVGPRIVTHGTNKGGHSSRGKWSNNAHERNPLSRGNPSGVVRSRTTLNLKAGKAVSVFWPRFPLYARAVFPVVRLFFCRFPTEQVLYYRNLGLYYGLVSTTLPLYLSCDVGPSLTKPIAQRWAL